MNIQFWPFKDFIQKYTTAPSRNKYADSHIKEIDVQDHIIKARVWGTSRYTVEIHYNEYEVTDAYCTCPYDNGGYCKHIINVLVYADRHLTLQKAQSSLFSEETTSDIQITRADKTLTLLNSPSTVGGHFSIILHKSDREVLETV